MTPRKLFLIFVVLAALAAYLTGVRWGLPGPASAELVMPAELDTPEFRDLMASTREDIYKYSGNSSLGRLREAAGDGDTPLMKSLNVSYGSNIRVGRDRTFLANLVRPYLVRSAHADEQMTLASLGGMKPAKLEFNPKLFQYGGAYIYGLGAFLYLNKLAGLVKLTPDIKYYFTSPGKMADIFTASRLFNAIFCLLALIPLYLIAARWFSPFVARLTLLLAAVCPAIVLQSHIVKPYCMSSFFAVMCVYYSLRILERPAVLRYHALAGVFFGLTSGSMPFYGMVLVAPALTYLFVRERAGAGMFALCGLLAFAATNPYWLLAFKDLSFELAAFGGTSRSVQPFIFFEYFFRQMPLGLHWLTLAVIPLGMAVSLRGLEKRYIVLGCSVALPIVAAAWLFKAPELSIHNTRFLLPWLSLGLIFFAKFVEYLYFKPGFRIPAVALLVLAAGFNAMGTGVLLANFRASAAGKSAYMQAGRWINANVKAGARVGLFFFPQPGLVPPFNFRAYDITIMQKELDPGMDYIVSPIELRNEAFVLAAEYLPRESVLGWKYYMRNSAVNAPAFIYKRVSGPPARPLL